MIGSGEATGKEVRLTRRRAMIGSGEATGKEVRLTPDKRKQNYERSFKGLRTKVRTSYILGRISLFLVFCALTWATAVLLGAYVQTLNKWDYIEIPTLLFLEYFCIWLVAFGRTVGFYRLHKGLHKGHRLFPPLVQICLPLAMGGLAVLGFMPDQIREHILNVFGHSGVSNAALSTPSPIASPAAEAPPVPYGGDMRRALQNFYVLIMLNAATVISEVFIKGAVHWYFLGVSCAQSLRNYHDKMLESDNSWMQPRVDLDFAFKMQSFDYRRKKSPKEVCEMYVDLAWYLYVHEEGFQAAEAAMADTDGYVKQAAANMVGFWAVLETLEEMQEGCRLPLRFQIPLLSKLADVAAESYGETGMAAARSIGLLMTADPVSMATKVQSEKGEGLVTILLKRVTQLLPPPASNSNLARILQDESCGHIQALRKLLLQLQGQAPAAAPQMENTANIPIFTRAQKEQIVREMQQSLLQEDPTLSGTIGTSQMNDIIQRLDHQLSRLLPPSPDDDANYFTDIRDLLAVPPDDKYHVWKAIIIVVKNLVVYVGSLFVGFVLGCLRILIEHS